MRVCWSKSRNQSIYALKEARNGLFSYLNALLNKNYYIDADE